VFTELDPTRLAGAQHVEGMRCQFGGVGGAGRDERRGRGH
jgi:hypothetical protein